MNKVQVLMLQQRSLGEKTVESRAAGNLPGTQLRVSPVQHHSRAKIQSVKQQNEGTEGATGRLEEQNNVSCLMPLRPTQDAYR